MPLSITIHRSAHEIGGNCIELRHEQHRLLLDIGEPLIKDRTAAKKDLLPATLDLGAPVDGVVLSHPHQDHYGLLSELPPSWPTFCGAPTEKLIRLTTAVGRKPIDRAFTNYESGVAFHVGPFVITPYLTDHSAFDAHMLLVEVAGKRVLYTGDFRALGRKALLTRHLMRNPPENIDVLLMEGTTLGRTAAFPTEHELEDRFVDLMGRTKGSVFVTWSAQNIDRSVTLYRACKRAHRTLVVDIYAADVLDQMGAYAKIPRPGWRGMKVVITNKMKWLYGQMGRPEFVTDTCVPRGMSAKALLENPGAYVVMLRSSLLEDFQKSGVHPTAEDSWSFSQWQGYLKEPDGLALRANFEGAGALVEHIHTSGHASKPDLLRFAQAVKPRHLVPIHSFEWDAHANDFENVVRLGDGVAWSLA